MRGLIFFCIIYLSVGLSYGRQFADGSISGQVTDVRGSGLPGITVQVEELEQKGSVTDLHGHFEIKNIRPGDYTLVVSGIGYTPQRVSVQVVRGNPSLLSISLEEAITQLDQVVVYGKTEAEELREQAYTVEVIDSKGFRNLSTDVNQMLRHVSGINLREEGGLGSSFSISLNGLSGNQVRTFIDGVPMDYFGHSLSLNNFPANLIQQVEVYKGVVPVHLSSDALGGAINVVTNRRPGDFLDASYGFGSFNTHRAALNAQAHHPGTGFTVRARSFYNYSDNNYKMDVRLVGAGGVPDEETTEIERFHDAYRSAMGQIQLGWLQTRFADELMAGVLYADNDNEVQQTYGSSTYNAPLGEVTQEESSLVTNLMYRKRNLLTRGLDLHSYIVYVTKEQVTTDTSSHRYDWLGGRIENHHPTTGETGRKSRFLLDDRNLLSNTNLQYTFTNNHILALNFSLNRLTREGEDDYHPQNATQFSEPSTTDKKVLALSYSQHMWDSRLKNTFFVKNYFFRLHSLETNWSGDEKTPFEKQIDRTGYGFASTYQPSPHLQVKLSYERTIRHPEPLELFGNGLLVIPNPILDPESSHNANLGFRHTLLRGGVHELRSEANAFYRLSDDFIRVQPKGILSQYVNQASVETKGIDATLSYRYKDRLSIGSNVTYQDLRNTSEWLNGKAGGTPDPYNGDRIPNIPFLYGNVVLGYKIPGLFSEDDALSVTTTQRYVAAYYLFWPSQGSKDSKNMIPSQFTQHLDVVYALQGGRYTLSLSVANLWDAQVYDNFNLQKPGRAFSMKARYFISHY